MHGKYDVLFARPVLLVRHAHAHTHAHAHARARAHAHARTRTRTRIRTRTRARARKSCRSCRYALDLAGRDPVAPYLAKLKDIIPKIHVLGGL